MASKHRVETSGNSHVVAAPVARRYTQSLIITRADRGVWDEVCVRCGQDPRNRRIRYCQIGAGGMSVHIKGEADLVVEWAVRPID